RPTLHRGGRAEGARRRRLAAPGGRAAGDREVRHRSRAHRPREGLTVPQTRDVLLPDIGDFDNVDVAEVLVKVGDAVAAEQSLIVLESDKASMEIPSPVAGRVVEMKVSVGDQVSQGALIARIEVEEAAAATPPEAPAKAPEAEAPKPAPAPKSAPPP